MVLLKILSGKMAGAEIAVRHFPFRIGRETDSDLSLPEPGVWDAHAVLTLERSGQFQLQARSDAFFNINGERFQSAFLRNGDLVEIGAAKIAFHLGATRHHSLVCRESLTWAALALLCAGQIALIYWLAR